MNPLEKPPERSATGWIAVCPLHGLHTIPQREKPVYCRRKVKRAGIVQICDRELREIQPAPRKGGDLQ